jgi:hypothetical protein
LNLFGFKVQFDSFPNIFFFKMLMLKFNLATYK